MLRRTCFMMLTVCGLAATACLLNAEDPAAPPAAAADKPVAHDLYFALKEPSPEARAELIAECRRCLAPHPGITYFATGILADDMKGMFVDRDFDVVVHMAFENRQALKTYARSKLHGEFITKQSAKFMKIRIFDSEIERYEPEVAAKAE